LLTGQIDGGFLTASGYAETALLSMLAKLTFFSALHVLDTKSKLMISQDLTMLPKPNSLRRYERRNH
jgi:hypothetical protein